MKVSSKEVLSTELSVLVALQFSLVVPEYQCSKHFERLEQAES